MKPRRIMTPEHADAVFEHAVNDKALAVVTTQTDDDWKTFKCRFLERDRNGRFFVLDYQTVNDSAPPALVPGQYVGVSFRHKSRKVLFATVVEARGRFVLDDQTSVTAIRYRWPDSLTELQRRAYYRTPIPQGANLVASVWSGGLTARGTAQESALEIRTGQILDLSCGGTLIRLNDVSAPAWEENETLGMELHLGDDGPPVLVNAHYRGSRPEERSGVSVAVQFIGLELTLDGRLVLQRLARWVQRYHRQKFPRGPRHGRPQLRG